MRHFLGAVLLSGIAMATASVGVPGAMAPGDPAAVSPDHYKVEIDNPWVHVLRLKEGPHEKTAMYEIPASVTVYLTDADEKFTAADGQSHEVHYKKGDASYTDAVNRSQENVSDAPIEEIIVELKPDAPKGEGLPPAELDPVKVEPKWSTALLENDRVRVLHTVLGAHFPNPLHAHPHNVVVFVIEPEKITQADGKVVDNPRGPGVVRWVEATKHATTNNTDNDTLEIQVELK
jgi:hypothetical protein